MPTETFQIESQEEGARLDVHLARILARHFSRSQVKKLIEAGGVKVGGAHVSSHYKVRRGDRVEVSWGERSREETRAENIPLNILYEDQDVVVVNKAAGMVVHPAHGNPHHTLVNALLYHFKELSQSESIRPGLVHRLDKGTSGVMLVAKNNPSHEKLARQFKHQSVERLYRVLVRGCVQHDEGVIEEPVGRAFLNRKKVVVKPSGGKDAVTFFRVLRRFDKASLLEVRLQTGRTHQIRVHMGYRGHPVLGDSLYGVDWPGIERPAVHAYSLGFVHPRTGKKGYFKAPLPEDMEKVIQALC